VIDVGIIGGGFSGTMVALNLARELGAVRIALIDRKAAHGGGLAYTTGRSDMLLNVPAATMGAFATTP
jgi:uncharacterized NAD(P)/FAD-binding protein YdhS